MLTGIEFKLKGLYKCLLYYDRQVYVGLYPPSGSSFPFTNWKTELPFDVHMQ